MQIDQKPEDYRVQRADGSWTQRVNKPLCRVGGLVFLGFAAFFATQLGESSIAALYVGGMMFCAGVLITLSLKSIDW